MTNTTTREVLHRVAAHVLGRRRYQVSGRFGLRASPGGFATPAFGDGPEVVRIAGPFSSMRRPVMVTVRPGHAVCGEIRPGL